MKAIYHGIVAHVTGDTGEGVILDGEMFVAFGDPALIVDPTDDQVEAAESGADIPIDPDDLASLAAAIDTILRRQAG